MKTRSDSKLAPHEDFIFERLVDGNQSYQTVADALEKELGLRTSASALCNFYQRNRFAWARRRAEAMEQALRKDPQNYSKARAAALAQREFELCLSGLSVSDLVALRRLDLQSKTIEQQQAALDLRIREFEQKADALRKTLERAKSKGSIDKKTIAEIEEKLGML
jgi:hypothetical protein